MYEKAIASVSIVYATVQLNERREELLIGKAMHSKRSIRVRNTSDYSKLSQLVVVRKTRIHDLRIAIPASQPLGHTASTNSIIVQAMEYGYIPFLASLLTPGYHHSFRQRKVT